MVKERKATCQLTVIFNPGLNSELEEKITFANKNCSETIGKIK
jgi:hypothetical protein